jgi:NAD(P)-dependent dehydrogenase (short-subunit alcohol dehydrogenase family)
MTQQIIFITGVSSGLGQALAEEALADGFEVVGTVRTESARTEFELLKPGSIGKRDRAA